MRRGSTRTIWFTACRRWSRGFPTGWFPNRRRPRLALGSLTIEPGTLNRHIVDFGIQLVFADWVPRRPYAVLLTAADGKRLGEWRKLDTPLIAPPGRYRVSYRQSEHYHSPVAWGEIDVPVHGFAQVAINSGVRFKPQPGVKPPYQAIFVALDGAKREYVWRGKGRGRWEPIPLPPGRYRLDWWDDEHGTKRMTLLDDFAVEQGALVDFEM